MAGNKCSGKSEIAFRESEDRARGKRCELILDYRCADVLLLEF